MIEPTNTFRIPAGWILLQVKAKSASGYYVVMARRISDGAYVTWEYNNASDCYHGHYFGSSEEDRVAAERDFNERWV